MKTLLLLLFQIWFCVVVAIANPAPQSAAIVYQISMPHPNTHYFEIIMQVDPQLIGLKNPGFIDLKLPTWTPGSYLIREYAKNVENFSAICPSSVLKSTKINKNTWRITGVGKEKITVSYKVYAYELTVRTSFLDDSHGYINGASMFMYIKEATSKMCILKVKPHASFKNISVALPKIEENTFEVENYDLLVDSPIEIGNHEILEFEALGIKHKIANYSNTALIYDKEKLLADYIKVVEASASVVGEKHPCESYLFIIHHLPGIGGGLEHLNSTTCQTSPDVYQNEAKYKSFLGLLAHEYFHLWNVKRIRPEALGPFDYENENYTHMLWVSEGFTSFYQDDILRRAGLIDDKTFLNFCANKIGSIENSPGNKVQSAAESSWDAWIKFYRPNENSNNSTISYYTKGGVLANILNLIIIDATSGEKSLDDVFKLLWKTHYIHRNVGFSDLEFQQACEKIAGKSLEPFFENSIYGVEPINYSQYYSRVGIEFLAEPAQPNLPWTGVTVRNNVVIRVDKGSGAYDFGINVNDEILSCNGQAFSNIEEILKGKNIGEEIGFTLKRSGVTLDYKIPLRANPSLRISLKPINKDETLKKYKKFMHL
jgi:predicted metalloprotease with PDZ domain